MLFLNYCIFSGSAEALVRCCEKLSHLLIAYFLVNTCAKHYENPTMLSRVTAKNIGDVFLRHTVVMAAAHAHFSNATLGDHQTEFNQLCYMLGSKPNSEMIVQNLRFPPLNVVPQNCLFSSGFY